MDAGSPFGPFFTVHRHEPDATPVGDWQPLADLVDDQDALLTRVAGVREALGQSGSEVELRVAGSVAQLGLAARLISPFFGAAVAAGELLNSAGMWWQPELGGGFPLSVLSGPKLDCGEAEWAELIGVNVLDGPIRTLTDTIQRACSVPPRVLWGNVASAVNGAATVVRWQRPDLAERAERIATALLARTPNVDEPGLIGPTFRRRSCCLIYRVAASGQTPVCGDCVLAREAATL